MDSLEVVDLEYWKDKTIKNAFELYCGTMGESYLLCARKPDQKQYQFKAFASEREQVWLDQKTVENTLLNFAAL